MTTVVGQSKLAGELTSGPCPLYTSSMEVSLTREQELSLAQVAARTGRTPEQLLRDALDAILAHEQRFAGAVEEARQAAHRGELLDHDELVARFEERYHS
jgi:predicted transcriptional regulator